jgi:hypothetical protein
MPKQASRSTLLTKIGVPIAILSLLLLVFQNAAAFVEARRSLCAEFGFFCAKVTAEKNHEDGPPVTPTTRSADTPSDATLSPIVPFALELVPPEVRETIRAARAAEALARRNAADARLVARAAESASVRAQTLEAGTLSVDQGSFHYSGEARDGLPFGHGVIKGKGASAMTVWTRIDANGASNIGEIETSSGWSYYRADGNGSRMSMRYAGQMSDFTPTGHGVYTMPGSEFAGSVDVASGKSIGVLTDNSGRLEGEFSLPSPSMSLNGLGAEWNANGELLRTGYRPQRDSSKLP